MWEVQYMEENILYWRKHDETGLDWITFYLQKSRKIMFQERQNGQKAFHPDCKLIKASLLEKVFTWY